MALATLKLAVALCLVTLLAAGLGWWAIVPGAAGVALYLIGRWL